MTFCQMLNGFNVLDLEVGGKSFSASQQTRSLPPSHTATTTVYDLATLIHCNRQNALPQNAPASCLIA